MNTAVALELAAAEQKWTHRVAFYEGDTEITHGEVHTLAAKAARVLEDHGVGKGSSVLIAMPDGIAWVITFLAVARLGATAVLANPGLTADRHRYIAEDSDASLVLSDGTLAERFAPLTHLAGARLLEQARSRTAASAASVHGDHPLYVQYTSGTTSLPKGVVHRHADLERYYTGTGAQLLGFGPDDTALSVSKLFFAYGLGNSLALPLWSGGAAVLNPPHPKPVLVAELVARHRVSYFFAVPSAYANILAETESGYFSSVRAAVSAGEQLTDELRERVTAFLQAPVYDQLGSTEAGHAIITNGVTFHEPGTVGCLAPGFEAEVRDRDGQPLPDGSAGELWVRGPTVSSGYLGLPEETARIFVDGWLNTRDRVIRNPSGSFVHLCRTDDLEMVGGITFSPLEIERVLSQHADVHDVAVVGIRNEQGASKLRAFVVPRKSAPAPDSLENDLVTLARAHLEPYKVPRTVKIVRDLPRTSTGKLQRFVIRQGTW